MKSLPAEAEADQTADSDGRRMCLVLRFHDGGVGCVLPQRRCQSTCDFTADCTVFFHLCAEFKKRKQPPGHGVTFTSLLFLQPDVRHSARQAAAPSGQINRRAPLL